MTNQKFYVFSFGGRNDFGRITESGEKNLIDFSSKPVGVGFALRNGVDIHLDMPTRIDAIISCSSDLDVSVEFKTVMSGGTPEKSERTSLKRGQNNISVCVPKLLSDLKEIVFFFLREKREDDVSIVFEKLLVH